MTTPLPESHIWLFRQLECFTPRDEHARVVRDQMLATLRERADCFERTCMPAHFTASAWVVGPAHDEALLVHHRGLSRWLQPGGHADGQGNLLAVALRELEEETGVHTVRPWPGIFDLDAHEIPATEKTPAHTHLDVRFAFEVVGDQPLICSNESEEVRWVQLSELAGYKTDDSVRRLALLFLSGKRASGDPSSSSQQG